MRFFYFLVVGLSLASCKTTQVDRDASSLSGREFPPITCSAGEAFSFTFSEPTFAPLAKTVVFPGSRLQHTLDKQDPNFGRYMRLDVCVDDTAVAAKRLIYSRGGSAGPVAATEFEVADGIYEAIFEQDHASLNVVGKQDSTSYIILKGFVQRGKTFAVVTPARKDGTKYLPTSLNVIRGVLINGDPAENQECESGQVLKTSKFALGTAVFETKQCEFLGGGETTGYKFLEFSVQDSRADLSTEKRKKFSFSGAEEIQTVLKYKWGHHNGCDSFYLKLPHIEYAATSSPLAGCNSPVPNAVRRNAADPYGTTLFRTRISGATWTEGVTNCAHYLFNCSNTVPRGQR